MTANRIPLNPSSTARALGAAAFLLVLASSAGQLASYLTGDARLYGLVHLFFVDAERNIPTGFSSLLLLFAALLLALVAVLKWQQSAPHVGYWAILSAGFLVMAADEAWQFHERLIRPMRLMLGNENLAIFYYAWVVPAMALVVILGLFFLRFLLRLPARTRLAFLVAAALYIGGAIGVELIGGRFDELYGKRSLTYSMIVTVEESLEMAGAIVFIWALLRYIADNYREVRLRF